MATLVNETMATAPSTGTDINAGGSTGWNAGGWFQLTNNVNQWDNYGYTGSIVAPFTAMADMQMSTTSGADGTWFTFGNSSWPHQEGDSAGIGYLIFRNDFGNSIDIRYAGSTLSSVSYTKDTSFDTFKVDVSYASSQYTFVITYKGSVVLTYTDTTIRTLPGSLYGWGARCGGTGNTHNIKNLLLTDGSGGSGPIQHNLTLLGVGA